MNAIAILAALALLLRHLIGKSKLASLKRQLADDRQPLSFEEARDLVKKYGDNSNSFLSLYEGFEFFTFSREDSRKGAIPFVERGHVRLGACDPFTAPGDRAALLEAFVSEAQKLHKTAVILPVSEATSELAKPLGYQRLMIGSEPTFDLVNYPPTGHTWETIVPNTKGFRGKGAKVREFNPEKISADERKELDQIIAMWLGSRKMAALSFLNKVEPWTHQSDKKYFVLEQNGEKIAFIAAIPFWPRAGWYLIDLMRKPGTQAGSTELLVIESMRILKEQGAHEVSLGVAPLSGLQNAPTGDGIQKTYRFLRLMYAKGGAFYNFDSLFRFKTKFLPSRNPSVFLIRSGKLGVLEFLDIFDVFLPGGLFRAISSSMIRSYSQFSLGDWIRKQLGPNIVVLSMPPNLTRLALRCKFATLFTFVNLGVILAAHGAPTGGSVRAIPLVVLGVGGLEYLGGTIPTILCTAITTAVMGFFYISNPATLILLASVSTLGGLSLFLRRKYYLMASMFTLWAVFEVVFHEPLYFWAPLSYLIGMSTVQTYFKIQAWRQ